MHHGAAHLGGHDVLPLGYQAAFVALAIAPHAEPFVALQLQGVAMVPAVCALGQSRRFLAAGLPLTWPT